MIMLVNYEPHRNTSSEQNVNKNTLKLIYKDVPLYQLAFP
jgi:hypothetical protein